MRNDNFLKDSIKHPLISRGLPYHGNTGITKKKYCVKETKSLNFCEECCTILNFPKGK